MVKRVYMKYMLGKLDGVGKAHASCLVGFLVEIR